MHSHLSFLHVTPLWSTTCIYLLPTFWLYGKNSSHRATGRRIRAENCLLFGREHKSGLKAPQTHEVLSSTSYLPMAAGKGEISFPSALKQLIKLKAINFNSADPKLVSGGVSRPGRSPWPRVQIQVWRQELRGLPAFLQSHSAHPGMRWGIQGQLPAASRLLVPQSSPQTKAAEAYNECHWRDNHLHSLLLTLERHFRYQEWAPQQGICTWLQDKLAFYGACCTYRTEVLGGLITQLTQRTLKIKCAK